MFQSAEVRGGFREAEVLLSYRPELNNQFETRSVLVYSYGDVDIIVPALFKTDLASIPRLGRWLFKGHGKYTLAAIVHDWLYARKGRIELLGGGEWRYTRAEADAVFLHALAELGVSLPSRYTMYSAVRAGGWVAWQR